MKKIILLSFLVLVVVIGGFLGARALLSPKGEVPDIEAGSSDAPNSTQVGDATHAGDVPSEIPGPIRSYDTGMATFTFDGTMLLPHETPSDDDGGYPMVSFVMVDGDDVLPRVDIMPLVMDEAIPEDLPERDWQDLAKTLILAYYNVAEHDKVAIDISNTVVKVDGDVAKLYLGYTTTLEGSATPNMSGAVRMTTKGTKAVITLALAEKGASVPQEMYDLYMSADIH